MLHGLNNAPGATKHEEDEEDQGVILNLRIDKAKVSTNELTTYSFKGPTMERQPCRLLSSW
jgi:hypothetical protein